MSPPEVSSAPRPRAPVDPRSEPPLTSSRPLPLPRRADSAGRRFEAVLLEQLGRVSTFYVQKAEELEVGGAGRTASYLADDPRRAAAVRSAAAAAISAPSRTSPTPPRAQELLGSDAIDVPGALSGAKTDIRLLIKFVALNYLAVVKAIKKRNRHLKVR